MTVLAEVETVKMVHLRLSETEAYVLYKVLGQLSGKVEDDLLCKASCPHLAGRDVLYQIFEALARHVGRGE